MIRHIPLAALLFISTTALASESPSQANILQEKAHAKLEVWLKTSAPESLTSRLAAASPEEQAQMMARIKAKAKTLAEAKARSKRAAKTG